MDFSNLFQSSDISTWSIGEWGVILLSGYVLYHVISDTRKVKKKIIAYPKKRLNRKRKRIELKQQLKRI